MLLRSTPYNGRRQASNEALASKEHAVDIEELESQSAFTASDFSEETIKKFDPVKRSQARRRELPPSRYVLFRL